MSEQAKIEIIENKFGRTVVIVNGKIAYESANPIPVEKKNIKRLLRMIDGVEINDDEYPPKEKLM